MRAGLVLAVAGVLAAALRLDAQEPPPPEWIPAGTLAATPSPTPGPTPAPPRASVSGGDATASSAVAPVQATIGDVLDWEVEVEAPEGTAVSAPFLLNDPAPFEMKEPFATLEEKSAAGRTRRRFRARLAVFETGNVTLPAAAVELRAAGAEARRIDLPAVGVQIASVLRGEPSPALKGAKGLARLPLPRGVWLLAGLIALLAILLVWYLRSRRPVVLAARPRQPELPYDERALRDLKALAEGALLRSGQVKEFHVRLSEILRAYLGARFGFDALEMTSDELNRALREQSAAGAARDLVRGLTGIADLVKFARMLPAAYENEKAVADAFRLIDITRPRSALLAPPAAPAGGAGEARA